ncbi:replication protein A 70 kDa DNA-binding subunit B-like [Primulina tabacum]|uniref:replication protein A 70 kDa DNA-binding subunit B-like n=1 Tax=Primulina tabacum TaxID=48773 RepID=UPI003F595A96
MQRGTCLFTTVVEKTKRNLQEFVIVNKERRPLILNLWEEFLQTEAPFLTQNVHTLPVILGMRLSVNTFYGLSIGTVPNSTILFDPPIQRNELLKRWLRFQAELFDGTENFSAYVEHKEASMLLCMSGEDIIEAEEQVYLFTS